MLPSMVCLRCFSACLFYWSGLPGLCAISSRLPLPWLARCVAVYCELAKNGDADLPVHMQMGKLHYVALNVFVALFERGYCRPQPEQEAKEGEGTEEASGTGMGEGKGEKDVSDELQYEEQLMGTDGAVRRHFPPGGSGGC
jgi:hypothetical protein